MKTITPPIPLISRLCLPQREKNTPYRTACHSITAECAQGVLLYQTLTGELLLLTDDEYKARDRDPVRAELIKHRFLVPETFDECQYADQIAAIVAQTQKPDDAITSYTVFTTMDCNARCFYCYELGRPRPAMDDETALAAAAFMRGHSQGRELKIHWFGGEPLLNMRAIDLITSALTEAGVPYQSEIITNGSLFDEATVQRAVEHWKLTRVQISLDGAEDTYNRAKAYTGLPESGFRRVLRNVGLLLDAGVKVRLRLNMNDRNAEEMRALAQTLKTRFAESQNLTVYPAVLMSFTGKGVGLDPEEQHTLDNYIALSKTLRELGLRRRRKCPTAFRLYGCMADDPAALTILPDGRIGKCEHESEANLIGSLGSAAFDQSMVSAWQERLRAPACASCPLYPQCRQLRKCEWNKTGCTALRRSIRLYSVQEMLLDTQESALS